MSSTDCRETFKSGLTCDGNKKIFSKENINHIKKKTVTFKIFLETSDDIFISRSIHNPLNKGPLISIMKKDCIKSRSCVPRKDRIVRPSRLTKILKNNANIDKTKFLSFRSVQLPTSDDYKNQLEEQDDNYNSACKIFPTGEECKMNELKLIDPNEDIKNCIKLTREEQCDQLINKWNMQKLVPQTDDFESRGNSSLCGVCSTTVNHKNILQNRKYGITACEFCRTFISKINKRTIAASSNSPRAFKFQCVKKEGECLITSLSRKNIKSFKKTYGERCSACWLKKCIESFHFPSGHKLRLSSLISETHNKDFQPVDKSQEPLLFKNSIDILTEKCNIDSQPNLFSWKRTILENGINESAKLHQDQTVLNNNSIENLVNGNITSDLFRKTTCFSGVNNRLNLLLNKNSGEIPSKSIELQANPSTTSEYPKRQTIAFKGPRVKHVCRSASIALGLQMATFSKDNDEALPLLQCSSEIENKSTNTNNNYQQTVTEVKQMEVQTEKQVNSVKTIDENEFKKKMEIKMSTLENVFKVDLDNENIAKIGPPALNAVKNNQQNLSFKFGGIYNLLDTNKGSAPKRNVIRLKTVPRCENKTENKTKRISIDFWDTYVPAEVNQTGFGLILTKPTTVFALCFLCGSMDLNYLRFCVSCCEPYHSYCIREAYFDDAEFFDKKVVSSNFLNRLNWMCPRCTVCDTCNMSSGLKVKCQKCKKNYHNTCMGTPKGLLAADRPLICRSCLKCNFCSTKKVSKYVGNQPTCIQCFMQRRSLSTCSLCRKCVDSVLEVIILECGVCHQIIHAKCEGLTEEQTNLLSSISSNIKFVCNKCSTSNIKSYSLAKQWKQAVCKELKSRLLQVLKLLSKCRLADLLKKSVKPSCLCDFDKTSKDHHKREDLNTCYKSKLNNIIGSTFQSKCLCLKSNIPQQTNNFLSLLDVKKKILNEEYVSLFDFNVDMNDVIIPLKNDELILTYKEIISQQFSWFQNETKTCTDALEEDMFDSCNYTFQTENIVTQDQDLSTILPLPRSKEKIFTPLKQNLDKRICIFCLKEGDGEMIEESRLLYYGFDSWVHVNCALWSMDVYEEFDGSLQNVHNAFIKGKLISCVFCGNSGATIKCNVKTCCNYYHFVCAQKTECLFEYRTSMFCLLHSSSHENTKSNRSNKILNVSRPLHIECKKSHKKFVEPFKVQFMLGSLSVIQLGTIHLPFSDTSEAIIPINFICTRLYWSSKEPWKVIKYKVRTLIQNSSITLNNELDKNFTVDHSKNKRQVERDLSQISFWHNTLIQDENIKACFKNENSYLNNLRFSTNVDYRNKTPLNIFIEDEPQNNSDLLLPEIEEAILEDLPNDILDGISVLDIFPKLMIHEDIEVTEGQLEKFNEPIEIKASELSIDCLLSSTQNKQLNSKCFNRKLELQNSNSEFSLKNVYNCRSQQESSSVTWAIENKRFTKDNFDLNLSETRLFNSNSVMFEDRVEDYKFNSNKSVLSKQTKNLTHFIRENIKLMQLDGADDHTAGFLSPQIRNTHSKTPVKCGRCHCTYRTFDSFQRHVVNCDNIPSSESETDTSSRSPESENVMIVVKDELNKDNLQIYQNQFSRIENVSTNVKPASNFHDTFAQSIGNTASLYDHIDKADYRSSSISGVNVNTLNNNNGINEKINYNKSNISNFLRKREQCKLFSKTKRDTVVTPINISKTVNVSQDTNNYLQLLNQNLMLSDPYIQNEELDQQQQQFYIIQQSVANSQPILIHQVPTPPTVAQNIIPVVLSNNSVQCASVPAFTSSFLPVPIWNSDWNVMLSSGLQMLHIPSMQLASASPQLVGSCNLPQTFHLGSNQVLLGRTPAMDLMPNANQLLLTPQHMFYGLETIVQNTVMSSQQFVSTAIQGVLSQNASFSATTTQVFQSSKFQPVNDASTSYVVLNNVDRSTQAVPQMNLLPEFLNTNSSHDVQNGYNPYFGSLNSPHPQVIIQQSDPNNIFSFIQTLPEVENTAVRAPTNQFQETKTLETSSNILSPVKKIVQSVPLIENKSNSENFLSQKWLENITHLKKVENDNSSFSSTMSSFVNDNNLSNANHSDFFEVQTSRPEINESTSKHKVQLSPRNIKRKNSSLTFSQKGLKIMCKNMFQKGLTSNKLQNVFLDSSHNETGKFCELLTESTFEKSSDPFASGIRNDTNYCSRDLFEIPKPIKSDPHNSLPSMVNRLESRESVHLSSTKHPFNTPSFGTSLNNTSTNILVPIIQTKQNKNTSRPTNRVLPMQSFQKAADTSKPKNRYIINENVQSLTPHEVEIRIDIASAEKEFEYIKPIKDVSEAENSGNIAYSMEKEITEHNATSPLKEPDRNILGNQKSVEKETGSLNFGNKTNILDSFDSVETVSNSSKNDFSDNNAYTGIEKCIKDIGVEKKKHEIQPFCKEEISKKKLSKLSDREDICQDDLDNFKQTQTFKGSNSPLTEMRGQIEADQKSSLTFASQKPFKAETAKSSTESYLIFEIQSEDGFSYKSKSISDVWEKVFEAVQSSRRAHGLPSHPIDSFSEICGLKILGLKTNALKYLIEQLPGTDKCQKYTPRYHENGSPTAGNVCNTHDLLLNSNNFASARCKPFGKRSSYDMFSWLASTHRKQPKQIFVQPSDTELIARRCTANLPMAMKYRTLKETCKHNVGVFRSLIHGRGLFCIKDMEAGEMVIEYAGELIRSTLADKRERFYDSKGIGCYMFKIDENFVVDATMRGNAARFINHSCEPNCYSKVVDILGHKHIIIFSLRRIVQGEELTYDYKFPFEDVKIQCYCVSKKCRKYLN